MALSASHLEQAKGAHLLPPGLPDTITVPLLAAG